MAQNKRFVKTGLALFLAGGVLGFWILNLQAKEVLDNSGVLSDYLIQQYKYMDLDTERLFYYILEKRIVWPLLLWALGLTGAGILAAGVWCGWLGILGGVLAGIGAARFGFGAVPFCIGAVLPQILFYIPAWMLLFRGIFRRYARGEKKRFSIRTADWRYGGILLVSGALFLLGILTESYINPLLMRQILRLF